MLNKKFIYAGCLLLLCTILILSCSKSENILLSPAADTIPAITTCSKTWMTKNLDVVTFRNGDTIAQLTGDAWGDMIVQEPRPAWCYFNDDPANDSVYGKLYSWAAVTDPRGLAPQGWHIATYTDWINLVDSCLGGTGIAGMALKEAEFKNWPDHTPHCYGTNSSGLNCLPGCSREGSFFPGPLGFSGHWWCGTGDSLGRPYQMWLYHVSNEVYFRSAGNDGLSVRCVKD